MIATILILGVLFMRLGVNAALHGQQRKGESNFWAALVWTVIVLFTYYKAGLFNNF